MQEQNSHLMNAGFEEAEADPTSTMETLPSLHDYHMQRWGEDLPISGGLSSGSSRADPIVINSPDPEIVARTQMQVLHGLARAKGVYWRCLGRELLGEAFPGIEAVEIETIELTPDRKITRRVAYYFDVSALPEQDWTPIKDSERFERLNVRFPCEVGWLHLGKITDYEIQNAGLGISLEYKAPHVTATLYIYDGGYGIPDDAMHLIAPSEFEAAANDIVARMGPNIVAWPDPPFDGRCHKRYFKVGEDAKECTMVALTTHKGNFVKMRVTWERDEFMDKVAIGWLEDTLAATFDEQSGIVPRRADATDWVVINEVEKLKVMIRESEIERNGTLVRVPVRYVSDPPGTDKRNGRAVAQLILDEEYDLEESTFRVHRIEFKYIGGGSSEFTARPQWKPATAGNEKTLQYLRGTTFH